MDLAKTVILTADGPALDPIYDDGIVAMVRPCDDDCDHNNCYQWRDWASVVCPVCNHMIGYDRSFFYLHGDFVHTVCAVETTVG